LYSLGGSANRERKRTRNERESARTRKHEKEHAREKQTPKKQQKTERNEMTDARPEKLMWNKKLGRRINDELDNVE
jgi:hypothetical protein